MTPVQITGKDIKAAWYNIAVNFDYQIASPSSREYLAKHEWSDKGFKNLCLGFQQLREHNPEIFAGGRYDWVFDRNSYDFISEVNHQFSVMCHLVGNIDLIEQVPNFPIVCARFVNRVELNHASPRVLQETEGISFIVVPSAWDDINWFSINGFLSYLGFTDAEHFWQLTEQQVENAKLPVSDWKSIITRILIGEVLCPDVQGHEYALKLIADLKQLAEARSTPEGPESTSFVLEATHLVSAFTLGHEVGHLLLETLPKEVQFSEDISENAQIELQADIISYRAMLACQPILHSQKTISVEPLSVWGIGGLLYILCLNQHYASEAASEGEDNEAATINALRFDLWQSVLGSYAAQNQDLQQQLPFLDVLSQIALHYCHHFYQFVQHLLPQLKTDASVILQQIANPDANVLEELEAEISKALTQKTIFTT